MITDRGIVPTSILLECLPPRDDKSRKYKESSALYNFQSLTVISSSKINKKVSQILELLHDDRSTKFVENKQTKVTVVSISARAPAASKAISVVEIVKRQVQDQAAVSNGGNQEDLGSGTEKEQRSRLFQYCILHSVPWTPKPLNSPRESKPNTTATINDCVLPSNEARSVDDSNMHNGSNDAEGADGDNEDDELYFETLLPRTAMNSTAESTSKTLVHEPVICSESKGDTKDVPVLTIVLSTAPLEKLRKSYGEQKIL